MTQPVNTRKSRFRASLALAEMTAEEWAIANGVEPTVLSRVLSGKATSAPLCKKIDAFIARRLKSVAA